MVSPEKLTELTWRGGYHGDTFLAMSVCDPEGGMHRIWDGVLRRQVFAGLPPAGFAAGLDEIFDEIATGFGRTGALFAAEHVGVSPDVMCVGKALTGGYLSLAAALATSEVARGITEGQLPVLAHGPTFMGNPLACAVANASLGVLLGAPAAAGTDPGRPPADHSTYPANWRAEVARIEAGLRAGLAAAVRAGVWLRPFRDLIYTMPPYVTSDDDVAAICAGVLAAVAAVTTR